MNLGEMLAKGLHDVLKEEEKKVFLEIPMKQEIIDRHSELEELSKKRKAIQAEIETKKKLMFAIIETENNIFDKNIHLDLEKKIIQFYE